MSETRYDKLADEFDAMRLEVAGIADRCITLSREQYVSAIERVAYVHIANAIRVVLDKYPQRNTPKLEQKP